MIKAVLIINDYGKPRLVKFFETNDTSTQQKLLQETYRHVSRRSKFMCNFIESDGTYWTKGDKLVYRHYATLYFIFVVDSSESELAILDIIRTFVETLDVFFRNVCELDIIFNMDKVHYVLDEIIQGGMVIETKKEDTLRSIQDMAKLEKSDDTKTK